MDFVDEEDDVTIRLLHLVDDRLQTLLKLALVFGTCHQRTHVQRVDLFVSQIFGHVSAKDSMRQSFDNRRLTRTRLTY